MLFISCHEKHQPLESNFSLNTAPFQSFTFTKLSKGFDHVLRLAMQYRLDGKMTGDVLYFTTAEIILARQVTGIGIIQRRNHRLPNLSTTIQVWLLKLYLIEETALEGLVHVLCEVGRGNEDAIQLFYLLKDDILNTVFHLLNGSFRPT